MKIWIRCSLLFFSALCLAASSFADDLADARAVGIGFLQKLEQKKNSEAWQTEVSDWFKQRMTRDAFLANVTIIQAQLGGPGSGRKLIQQNKASGMSGYSGDVYSFTFATTFPTANVYEQVALIREGGAYRVTGMNFVPNPNK